MKKILKTEIQGNDQKDILEKIVFYIRKNDEFCHIVSLNPENVVTAVHHDEFQEVLNQAQIQIVDGVGIALGCSLLGIKMPIRITGVNLMEEILEMSGKERLRVLFIGGDPNLADELSNCYQKKHAQASFKGILGIKNIKKPKQEEEEQIFSIVAEYRPQIIFAAFGSPWQELWFYRNRASLQGIVCMGVGGSFDFLTGKVPRAPKFLRSIGLEWLFRLVIQPWRWKRQLRLIEFVYLILKQKITGNV